MTARLKTLGMVRFFARVTCGLSGRDALLSIASGMLASLALPPYGLVPMIAFLSLPALKLASSPTLGLAAWYGWCGGLGWFLASIWWISLSFVLGDTGHWPLLPFALFGLPALLALFWAPAAMLARWTGQTKVSRVVWFVLFLTLAEWMRGFVATGFPWNAPGYVFSAHLALLQNASLTGLYGLTLLALFAAMLPAFWFLGRIRLAVAAFLLLPVLAGFGMLRLAADVQQQGDASIESEESVTVLPRQVRLVQPVVPQDEKWRRDLRVQHLDLLRSLSRDQVPVPQLIIWPETAFAGLLDREEALFRETVWSSLPFDGWLITGVPRFDSFDRLFNSAALVRPNGEVAALYSKQRLVPFGEFIPFRSWLPFATALVGPVDFSPGLDNEIFELPHYGAIEVQICYETIFPRMSWNAPRADMLVNLTNDAWFGDTPGPWQHLAKAQMRAVEEGVPMVRVANTGISAAFDGYGRTLARIELNEIGFVDVDLPPALSGTLFAKWRFLPCFVMCVLLGLIAMRLDRTDAIRQ